MGILSDVRRREEKECSEGKTIGKRFTVIFCCGWAEIKLFV